LFDRYRNLTLAVLTGFVTGSLNKVWPWKEVVRSEMINGKLKILEEQSISPFNFAGDNELIMAIVAAIVGFVIILLLEKLAVKKPE